MQHVSHTAASSWVSPALRVARRLGYGVNRSESALAIKLGAQQYLDYQLAYETINDSSVDRFIKFRYPRAFQTAAQLVKYDNNDVTYQHIYNATLAYATFSKRQLFQRMVEFWNDHFNTSTEKIGIELRVPYDNAVIRPNAMGKFGDLLLASAKSAAMLEYLDGADSSKDHPNQNYARELMELHTLGVNGGYTQQDVVEVARCFTGWDYDGDYQSPTFGQFMFNADNHDTDQKVVLGHTIPAGGGVEDGLAVLNILLTHPSTANFVSRKLINFFVGITPSASYLAHVAGAFTSSGGDIRSTIRAVFDFDMLTAPVKVKRPMHMVVSAMRQFNTSPFAFDDLWQYWLQRLNNLPFDWPAPNGYPDNSAYWANDILSRWELISELANNNLNAMKYPLFYVFRENNPDNISASKALSLTQSTLLLNEASSVEIANMTQFINAAPIDENRLRGLVAIALCSPSFQYF